MTFCSMCGLERPDHLVKKKGREFICSKCNHRYYENNWHMWHDWPEFYQQVKEIFPTTYARFARLDLEYQIIREYLAHYILVPNLDPTKKKILRKELSLLFLSLFWERMEQLFLEKHEISTNRLIKSKELGNYREIVLLQNQDLSRTRVSGLKFQNNINESQLFRIFYDKLIATFENFHSKHKGKDRFIYYQSILKRLAFERRLSINELEHIFNNYSNNSIFLFMELYFYFLEGALRLQGRSILTLSEISIFNHLNRLSREIAERLVKETLFPFLIVDLWNHQKQAYNNWKDAGKCGIIEMATATGKTMVALKAIADFAQERKITAIQLNCTQKESLLSTFKVNVICHSKMLLNQWKEAIIRHLCLPFNPEHIEDKLSIAGIEIRFITIQKILSDFKKINRYRWEQKYGCDFLIIDEIHHTAAKSFRTALQLPNTYRMGLSATIDGNQKLQVLQKEFGGIVFTYTLEDAIRDNIIPSFKWVVHEIPLSISEKEEYHKITRDLIHQFEEIRNDIVQIKKIAQHNSKLDQQLKIFNYRLRTIKDFLDLMEVARFTKGIDVPKKWQIFNIKLFERRRIIYKSIPKRNEALEFIAQKAETKKCVAFTMDIETCHIIAQRLNANGIPAFEYHSDLSADDLKRNLKKFKHVSHGVLISPKMLDEGIDIPDAEIGINIASTKSRLQLVQRIGRILRKSENPDKNPEFHHFIATIEDLDVFQPEDSFIVLDELAWVNFEASRLGSTLIIDNRLRQKAKNVLRALEILPHIDTLIRENLVFSYGGMGSIKFREIIEQLSPDEITRLIERLVVHQKMSPKLSEEEWLTYLRSVKGIGENESLQFQGHWWFINIFDGDVARIVDVLKMTIF